MLKFRLHRALVVLAGALLLAHQVPSPVVAQDATPLIGFQSTSSSYPESTDNFVSFTVTWRDGGAGLTSNDRRRFFRIRIEDVTATGSTKASAPYEDDYTVGSTLINAAIESGATSTSFSVRINQDQINEGNETFRMTLEAIPGSTAGDFDFVQSAANLVHEVTIVDDDPPAVTLTPNAVDEDDGTVDFTLELNGVALAGRTPRFEWYTTQDPAAAGDTATPGEDYVEVPQTLGNERNVVTGDGSNPTTFSVTITDDDDFEGDETFTIVVAAPVAQQLGGTHSIATLRHVVTIRDDDQPEGPDPILAEISNHLIAQSETQLATQPRLTDYVRNTGIGASDFALRISDGGLEALDGGIAGEGFWGEATFSRSGSRGADGKHVVASLGAHRQMSDHMYLGGMLQFDRTVTELDGGGRSGEFVGEGWMVGPYVVGRDPSRTLFFEGRLLYGHASHDADAIVFANEQDPRRGPRSGTFDSERWIAQARVEGEYSLGAGTIMYPLADFSHARNAANGFDETNRQNPDLEMDLGVAVRTAVSKLQLGTEFEIPLDPARGDLIFRPGLKLEFSDRKGVAFGKSELSAAGRIDLGIDYRLKDSVALGIQGYYSGIGQGREFESYGAGLRLRMEF